MPVTKEMQKELANLARAANRRLERASEGQRKSLEYNIRGYHTRKGARGTVFQQGAAKNEREYRQRMAELHDFMAAKTSKKTGWKQMKKAAVSKANETLQSKWGYNLTDKELDIVLRESAKSSIAFYRNLEIVSATKDNKAGELSEDEISSAIQQRRTDYETTVELQKKRRERIKKGLM